MTRKIVAPDVLTRGEAAWVLNVHPSTVARWAATGFLPSFRIPSGQRRYRKADVEDLLNSRRPAEAHMPLTFTGS